MMECPADHLPIPTGNIPPQGEVNKALVEENKRLRLALEQQASLEKRYEESQERFPIIFERSQFGNKIIDSALTIVQVNEALQNG